MSTPVTALYEDMTFTPIMVDGADAIGFNDILEVALGEPGDETVVVRITTSDIATAPPTASIDYFVGDLRLIFRPDASFDGGYTSCAIDGGLGYCVVEYDTLGLAVGDEVPAANAISYFGTAVDCAPNDTPGLPCVLLSAVGDAYILQGCTATSCMPGASTSTSETASTTSTSTASPTSTSASSTSATSTSASSTSTASTSTSSGSTTGSFPLVQDKDSPAAGFLAPALLLVALALVARRRLP